jgi:hypothetical protein
MEVEGTIIWLNLIGIRLFYKGSILMKLSQHILFSGAVFGTAYVLGLKEEFVLIAFLASVLVDVDHLFIGGLVGTYNPKRIYDYFIDGKFDEWMTPKEVIRGKIFGSRFFPLHNIWVCGALLWIWPPVGVGMAFHYALDFFDVIYNGL